METTLVLVKPDGVSRCLIGEVVKRVEARGLQIVGLKILVAERQLAEEHYAEHKGKPFFAGVCDRLVSGPSVAMAVRGENAVKAIRAMMGATDPADAAPGTVRGDLGHKIAENITHSSSNQVAAVRELAIWFPEGLCR